MAAAGIGVPRLVVLSAPGHEPLELTSPEMIVGRAGTADLVLDDPFVSRRHALVTIAPAGDVQIQDLDSTGGTFVNDERISGRRVLRPGDLVRFADLVTRFEAPAAAPETLAMPVAAPPPPATDYGRVRAVKKTVQGELLTIPGVQAVGIGPKMTSGQRTDVPSIIVFLTRKLPAAEIRDDHVIPPEIDGVSTDVVEIGVPRLLANGGTAQPPEVNPARPRPMCAGVAVTPKYASGHGTLGCFATTQDNPPKVVAITCQHVVAPALGDEKSGVTLSPPPSPDKADPFKISFVASGDNKAGSLVFLRMGNPSLGNFHAFLTVTAADTAATIASGLRNVVNGISGAGLSAGPGPNPGDVVITAVPGSNAKVHDCAVFDPPAAVDDVKLLAAISGNVITLTGKAAGAYGIYTSWDTISDPTRSAFTPVTGKADPPAVATAVAASISAAVTAQSITGITATATGATVTIQGAVHVSCQIMEDNRMGQPTDDFSSNCSLCCTDEMGRVLNADIATDSAIIQVRRGLQYLNEIYEDPSAQPHPFPRTVIRGTRTLSDDDVHQHVTLHKRGQKTGYTSGKLSATDVVGYATESPAGGEWTVYYRAYDQGVIIQDDGAPFGAGGDSGAPVFDDPGKLVGIMFGYGKPASGPGMGLVTPIGAITDALKITIATSTDLGQKHTVTDAQGAPAVVMRENDQLLPQLLTARAEITATPAGKRYDELVSRHAGEVQALVNENLRVAVVWHRNSGPEIVRSLFRMIQSPDRRLPEEIDGVPVAERLARIRDALIRYGSTELAEDLNRYSAELLRLTSLTYAEALAGMRAEDT